jgi:hypothetical protein
MVGGFENEGESMPRMRKGHPGLKAKVAIAGGFVLTKGVAFTEVGKLVRGNWPRTQKPKTNYPASDSLDAQAELPGAIRTHQ